ncbi:stage III sporulation protein AG [Neobacillus sp. PS3-34]|uniref:stage III sporulation protein AG n=1 Tax=Neobacillus sp. PS3-34 TaxID=3070678 RepID=UPI0027E1A55E|nr:stage III sporulation protein AG [Neobacillus sp. PS3-34]WML47568.1 stage III sporulation protein AG [Neobacillus sp. PS3-34]
MDKENGPFSWLKKWLSNEKPSEKKAGKYQYMLLVLCIGAAFMLAGNILFKDKTASPALTSMKSTAAKTEEVPAFGIKKSSSNKDISNYERAYESQLKDALEAMLGVKDVRVVVNIDSSETKVLEKNRVLKNQTTNETDKEGGTRKVEDSSVDEQLVITRNGDKEVPIIVETKKPEIRGVLVVAKGAEDIQVKKWIIEAVTRALGVPSHRVAVMPKK